jgi:hypothetical protein
VLTNSNSSQLEGALKRSSKVRYCKYSKTFTSIDSLDQHRNSAAHAKPTYHYPTYLLRRTYAFSFVQSFKTLSGLAQHLEAKLCVSGASTLREVGPTLRAASNKLDGRLIFFSRIRNEICVLYLSMGVLQPILLESTSEILQRL